VVDSTTGLPVGAGFVVLVDTLGNELVRTLTSQNGAFEIRSPRTGFVRLRSERIGYRPWESSTFELRLRETLEYSARVSALPVRLATIETRRETSCRMRAEESRAVTLLWEESRKALVAASWNAEQGLYRQTLGSYRRDLDRRRRRVEHENTVFTTGLYEVPFRSREPRLLATQGYVTYEDGANWYFAPDANVLLDETFHTSHCFKVVEGEGDDEGLIGLGFEPVRGATRPDVRGTLWLNVESAELKRIEFSYTGLPLQLSDDRIGGTIEFLAMPTGAWIVHKWQIRTPFVRSERMFGGGQRQVVEGFRDTGGEVLVVTSLRGDSIYSAPTARIEGTVVDSSRGDFARPLSGAVVSITGTSFSALSGSQGRFVMDAPLHGTYVLSITHPRVDSLGIEPPAYEVTLSPGEVSHVAIGLGSISSAWKEVCGSSVSTDHAMAIVGIARDRFATPIPEARIEAYWQTVPVISDELLFMRNNQNEVTTDARGRFAICDIPRGVFVTLRGSQEVNGTSLEGITEFRYVQERNAVRIGGLDQHVSWVFLTDPILKIDLSLMPVSGRGSPRGR
jgi:hypothetical protein